MTHALIERELRRAMVARMIRELPLYPEERATRRPTAEKVFRLSSLTQRHTLYAAGTQTRVFHPELTELQAQVLEFLRMHSTGHR